MTIGFFVALYKLAKRDFLLNDIKEKVSAIKTCVKINDTTGINLLTDQIIEDIDEKELYFKKLRKL